jgi:hypothetical protein
MPEDSFLPPHGNYAELLSYQKAELVYDLTFRFCQRFLAKSDRTIDQMVQAARSGKQNIVEGSKASDESHKSHPVCPLCSKPMALRTAQQGKHAGSQFWGCTAYLACKGTRPVESGKS